MIKALNLSYSFPEKMLYHNISFTLEEGQHCAFIGVSGSGKSTLVNFIMHPDDYMFEGSLEIAPNCRMGYVSQFSNLNAVKDMTVFEYIGEKFIALQNEIAALCSEMETASDLDALFEKYQNTLDTFSAMGGDNFESNITKQLALVNLSRYEQLPVANLSGGEFKLVQVIKEMLINPNLLIMDEPDVFLDFEHINALKDLMNTYKGTLLVITHNRYLLNHCFNKILHLENTELQEFDGRYIDYNFSLLQTKIELLELSAADTEEIERNNEIIDKLRTAASNLADPSKGKALRARLKIQERLEARRIKAPFVAIKQPAIHFPELADDREDAPVLTVTDYHAAYEDTLLENVSFEIGSKDKVALIGPNGCGKTTLLRAIYQNNSPAICVNETTQMTFLSQLQGEGLNEEHTLLDAFLELGFEKPSDVRSYLLGYGFGKEMMHHKISALSGGEKNILQLAKITLGHSDLLLLDEPTSHLDTYAQLALEKAINDYNGAVLMISHDFYSIANCMDYVLLIENQTVRKMSIRKFRKMIYAKYFDKDYLEIEQKKKTLETKIEMALKANDFNTAKSLSKQLEPIIKLL